jgi:N-acetyl-1-D-myo-inositol-2-amino-2-deoxy-alpha-D-glucopyranoside deacetylase
VRAHEASRTACRQVGLPFAEIVPEPRPDAEWFQLDAHLGAVTAALRQHASQLTVDGTDVVHAGGRREAIRTSVGLHLA